MTLDDLKRDFILLNIGYAYHDCDWNWKNIKSPFTRIHFVKNGTAKIIHKDKAYELKKNHLYLTPSHTLHSYECDDILELYYIHIYEDSGKSISMFETIDFPVEIESDPIDIMLIERLITINAGRELKYYDPKSYNNAHFMAKNIALDQKNALAYTFESQSIINQIISRFLAASDLKKRNIEPRVLKTLEYIHKNLYNTISVDTLAEICFLTKDHFIRLFKKEMNCTPIKYINIKKIEKAQLLILIEESNIKDIAYSLGFNNISYFNRLFFKVTGDTPLAYKHKMLL